MGECGGASGGVVGGWAACNGGRTRGQCSEGCCGVSGSVVCGEAAVGDTVEAVGKRRWWDGPRRGCGLQHLGTTQQCNGQCCWGRGGGATDNGGGCSGVFAFYLHMGMGEIHWREEVDPNIIRITDRDICKRYFFSTFFLHMFLPSVGCRVG